MQRCDIPWLAFVIIAALAFSVWGLPYFSQLGHPLLAIPVYLFFGVLFLYGRANRPPQSKRGQFKKIQRL